MYPTISLFASQWNETETPRNHRRLHMTCDFDLCNCITLANARPCLYLVSYLFPINLVCEASVNNKCWKDKKMLLNLSRLKSSCRFFLKRQGRKLLVHLYLTQNPHNGAGNIPMLGNKILQLLVNKIKVV